MSFRIKRLIGRSLDNVAARRVPGPVKSAAEAQGGIHRELQRLAHRVRAPIWFPTSVNDAELCDRVRRLDADLTIVAGLDRIVREPALSTFPTLYNLHPSLLPEYRGAVPEFWQLDDGLERSGVTIHRIDPGIDTGPIVVQQAFDIEPWLDCDGLIARSVTVGNRLVDRLLDGALTAPPDASPQSAGSYQPIPDAEHHRVPVERTPRRVLDRSRAVGFDRPLHVDVESTAWQRGDALRLVESSPASTRLDLYEPVPYPGARGGSPGDAVRTGRGGLVVWCTDGAVEFRRVTAAQGDNA